METRGGHPAMLIPGPQFPKDSLLPRRNISGRQKSIPRCKMPFQGRRRFEDAGEHLPMLAGAGGHLAPGHGGVEAEGDTALPGRCN